MKRTVLSALAALAIIAPAAHAGEDPQALAKEARGIVMGFMKELKGTLVPAMKEKGPVAAIEVCSKKAGEIAKKHSVNGWQVGRTALKLRNAKANAPDAWEKATLEMFEKKITEGADPKTLARAEVVDMDGKKVFRFMKAIPVGKPCLTCHGGNVKADVLKAIRAHYPDDRATGFRLGQLRGAFTLKKPLQ